VKSNPDAERVEDLSPPEKISVTPGDRKGSSAPPRRQPHFRHHARNYSRHIHVGFDLRRQAVGVEPVKRSGSMDAGCSWINPALGEDDWPLGDCEVCASHYGEIESDVFDREGRNHLRRNLAIPYWLLCLADPAR
jgi:hypothetical protein